MTTADAQTPGVVFATTDGGVRLPVIDVTHPASALTVSDAELARMAQEFLNDSRRRRRLPAFLQRLIYRVLFRRSMLGRGLMEAHGTFLSGLNTYLLKLGPDLLPSGVDDVMDRFIARSLPVVATRLRLQDMAELLADGIAHMRESNGPLCLLNIAGGPGADSWNALIRLRRDAPSLVDDAEIAIAILDVDSEGPAFGARAVEALTASGAPLHGLRITFRHVPYRWPDTSALTRILRELHTSSSRCVLSSEGGLFEYGTDDEIAAVLSAFAAETRSDALVAGTVTRAGDLVNATQGINRVTTIPRTREAFEHILARTPWTCDRIIERPFSYNVRLGKAVVQ